MTHTAAKLAILGTLAASALAPSPAVAKDPPASPPAGRNFVGAKVDASSDPYRKLNMFSSRVAKGGDNLNVWLLSRPRNCAGFDIITGKVPIDGQGRFEGTLPVPSGGTSTVRGHFVKTKHNGIVARTTIRSVFTGKAKCDTGDVSFTAISPHFRRKGAGQPKPNALFVGLLKQSSSRIAVRLPMLALISPDGTQVKRWIGLANVKCKSGGFLPSTIYRVKDIPIEDDGFEGVTGTTQPIPNTQQKRTLVLDAKGTFGERRLTGTWHVHEVHTDPYAGVTDDCDSGEIPYVAARVRSTRRAPHRSSSSCRSIRTVFTLRMVIRG